MKGVKGRGLKNLSDSDGIILIKSKKRRIIKDSNDEFQVKLAQRLYKRVLLSLGNPSSVLGLASTTLRPENRIKLTTLLSKFVRRHDWISASGVLSVLLRDTQNLDPHIHRFKYWVLLKLLQHIEGDCLRARTIGRVFYAWMSRIGIKLSHTGTNSSMNEVQFVVRLEAILFNFMQGHVEQECQNARSLIQERRFEGHPMFNMIIGLIFYQLWYSGISPDMQLKGSNQLHHDIPSDMEADTGSHSDIPDSGFVCDSYNDSEGNSVPVSNASGFVCDSYDYDQRNYVSVSNDTKSWRCEPDMKNKQVLDGNGMDFHKEDIQFRQPRGFYFDYDEASDDQADDDDDDDDVYSTESLEKMDLWLRPIVGDKCGMEKAVNSEEYKNAVMYLSRAASSTPPVLAALLPLVQLLLIRNDWKEALRELDNFCSSSSGASLPHRLKSCLLENINPNNSDLLSRCYEGTLKSDPTCTQSMAKLVRLHQLGMYSSEALIEMIALHLDAVMGEENNVRRELALYFVGVLARRQEEDGMVSSPKGEEELESRPGFLVNRESWKLRCKWWKNRHFSKNKLASDIAAGDLERLAYKAACASHLYGPEVRYAVEANRYMHGKGDSCRRRDLTLFLEQHMRGSVAIDHHFQ